VATPERIVIAGGGVAAQRCAFKLRELGFDGTLTMVCGEEKATRESGPQTWVLDDVVDGLLSLEAARDVYGVAIELIDADADAYRIEDEATAVLRHGLGHVNDEPPT